MRREFRRPFDRAAFEHSWGLGWVLVMCEIGYLLADVLIEDPDLPADEVARVVARAREAVDLAREAVESC